MNVATTFGAETVGSTDAGQGLPLAGIGDKGQALSGTASTNSLAASQPAHLSFRSSWQAQLASLSGMRVSGDPDAEMTATDESSESSLKETTGSSAAVASTSTPVLVLRLTLTGAEQSDSGTGATVAVLTRSSEGSSAQQTSVLPQSRNASQASLPGGMGKIEQTTKQASSTDVFSRDAPEGTAHQKRSEQGTASIAAAAQDTSVASIGSIPLALPVAVQEASQSGLGIQPASDDLAGLSESATTSGIALKSAAGNQALEGNSPTIKIDEAFGDKPQDAESLSGIQGQTQETQTPIGALNQNQIGDAPVTASGNLVDQNRAATVASSSPLLAAPSKAAQVGRYEGTASAGVGSGRPVEADASVQTPVAADSDRSRGVGASAHDASRNQTSQPGLRYPDSPSQQGLAPTGNQPAGQASHPLSSGSGDQGLTTGDDHSVSSSAALPIAGTSAVAAPGRIAEQVGAHSSRQAATDEQIAHVNHSMQAAGGVTAEDAPSLVRNPAATRDANSTSGETGGNSTVAGAGSTVHETFSALDSRTDAAGTNWIHAGTKSAEAGFQDPVLGWVGVRADINGGGVHATLMPSSSEAAQALGGQLAGLNAYLAEGHAHVQTLTLATPGGAGTDFSAGQNANQGMNQGTGQNGSYEPPSGSGRGMAAISAAGLSGASAAVGTLDPSPAVSFPGSTHISVMA